MKANIAKAGHVKGDPPIGPLQVGEYGLDLYPAKEAEPPEQFRGQMYIARLQDDDGKPYWLVQTSSPIVVETLGGRIRYRCGRAT